MARQHSNIEKFRQAKQIAKDYGLTIGQKGDKYYIFRNIAGRGICVGSCGIDSLFNKVCRLTTTH